MKTIALMTAACGLFLLSCSSDPSTQGSVSTPDTRDESVHEAMPGTENDTVKGNATVYPADSVSNTSGSDNATPQPEGDTAKKGKKM